MNRLQEESEQQKQKQQQQQQNKQTPKQKVAFNPKSEREMLRALSNEIMDSDHVTKPEIIEIEEPIISGYNGPNPTVQEVNQKVLVYHNILISAHSIKLNKKRAFV